MNEMIVQSEISSHILTLRGKQVMLDRDLASLYQVETKRLNEQVKRNIDRFPEDFMFQLNESELKNWKSQFATSNKEIMGLRKSPFAFTEEGIYMLATVLNSSVAVETNIAIIRTFKKLREFSKHYNALAKQLIEVDRKHDKHYKELKKSLDELIATSEVAEVKVMGFLK
ncbi:MAG TPA: ORF6N domain-containing protein [Sulfurovum sp.]|nr:ORF6N domain-containing protein [Sulfurovum sp.]